MTRGIRNNNPGNIRRVSGVTWQGEAFPETDDAFVQFTDPKWGIRAIARIMASYERRGINTLEEAINMWAPPNENNSEAYVEDVCEQCQVGPETPVRLTGGILPSLITAIIKHENSNEQPYSDEQIAAGIALAENPS